MIFDRENNIPTGVTDPADQEEVKMKTCPICEGKEENMPCELCYNMGEVEMTFEECRDEDELIRESQAEL